jgi:hypothetical protein
MHLDRLRAGEILAGLGAIALLLLLFGDWVRPEATLLRQPGADIPPQLQGTADRVVKAFVDANAQTGWHGLGWLMVAVLLLAVIAALTLVVLTVTQEPVGLAVGSAVITTAIGIIATVALLIRLTLAQPDLGAGLPDRYVDVLAPAWLGQLSCLLIAAGGWITMADERTGAPYSTAPDLPPRRVDESHAPTS